MKNLAKHISNKVTPQSRAIPGKPQAKNSAGGFCYVIDCWNRLQRFLILGSDGGTYYTRESTLTIDNAKVVDTCATEDARRTVDMIVSISESGRAPKNDPAILAIAILASATDPEVRKLALAAMPRVCRIGTHLFQFIAACKELRGWGRGMRDAVAGWYNNRTSDSLAYQVTKYRNRVGYTHRDALRLSHPQANCCGQQALYKWIVSGELTDGVPRLIEGFNLAQSLPVGESRQMCRLISDYGLTFEHIPNQFLNQPEVWEVLLPNLKPTALIRNLGKMTSVGLLRPLSASARLVVNKLTDTDLLKQARVHPLSVLLAADTYSQGHGFKGSLCWTPVPTITAALEDAFYAAFDAVEPTGKRHMLALDVSGSMGWSYIAGTHLDARKASACMSLVTNRVEPETYTVGFSGGLTPLNITSKSNLESVLKTIQSLPMNRTDCAQPMLHAIENKLEVDAFVVYTDNETWSGGIHPSQALNQYRQASGIDAKLIVVGMTATGFSIADPNDAGMLDVVGMDASVPAIMADFVR